VRIRRKGSATTPHTFSLPRLSCAAPDAVHSLLARIQRETEMIWIDPPREIVDLHNGLGRSGAGSYDQYFNTLSFSMAKRAPWATAH